MLVALQLEDILCDAGHHVIGIVPDRETLGGLREPPMVALVDLNLRDGPTGPQIARNLADNFATVIVYVTANPAQIGEPAQTAIGVIQKPVSQSAILAAIDCAMGVSGQVSSGLEPIG